MTYAPPADITEQPAAPAIERQVPLKERLGNLIGVSVPLIGVIAAMVFFWGDAFHWVHLVLLVTMYLLTATGITVGFHRLFTHKAFKTGPTVRGIFAFLGGMAVEGPLIQWVAIHRFHHQHSDDEHDPHSPHGHGHGFIGMLKGMFHAHMGWMFREQNAAELERYVPDLRKDKVLTFMSKTWLLWSGVGLLIPTVIAGLITWSWEGALLGFLWGGLVRIFLVHHVTWSINSICHVWGTKPFNSHDESRNNFFFGIFGLGEGWHNNHHAFPTSARHGLRWWEIDISYMIIRTLEICGLAWDVKVPEPSRIAAKQ